jgi:hypothetical protein
MPITEEELKTLESFGKDKDGSYSDYDQFCIVPHGIEWHLYWFDEMASTLDLEHIKKLESMDDLREIYFALTFKELE